MTVSPLPQAHDVRSLLRSFFDLRPPRPLIAVIGPTASGKTALSLTIAKTIKETFSLSAEIVNADSRQLYRSLDIGTAKIATEEMRGIPHHLFSVLDPREECSIAWYQVKANEVIRGVQSHGNVPILVGGSMLYVSSIIDGLEPLPAPDKALRERLEKRYDEDGGESLYRELQSVDPISAEAIDRRNKVYVIRALEIFHATGKPKSAQRRASGCPYDLLMLGVLPPADLKSRIIQRTEAMFALGWADEVRGLLKQGYGPDDPGIAATGYRAVMECVQEGRDPLMLTEAIARETVQYAKRQMTWWRGDERIMWVSG